MGLPRPLRLSRSEDFARVRAEGQTFRSRLMLINVAANGLKHNRFGLVTGKRLGGAVTRNRIRRVLREILRESQDKLASGWDIVVVPHPSSAGQPFSTLENAFRALSEQAGLLND